MIVWNQDNYIKAWNFASSVHNGQLLPTSDIPYINHLGLVAMETMSGIANSENIASPDLAVLYALLHDSIEDTNCSFEDIKNEFGSDVANGVMALTKNTDLPTKEDQMLDSLNRIQDQPKEVWMVKLSDRITNLQPPPKHWDKSKIAKYRSEAILILEVLGSANDYLAKRLRMKIENYAQYE